MSIKEAGDMPDYTDFEHEAIYYETQHTGSSSSGTDLVNYQHEVLEDRGGLESDEVAELVHAVLSYKLDPQSTGAAPQNGSVGIHWGSNIAQDEVLYNSPVDFNGSFELNNTGASTTSSNLRGRVIDDPGLFSVIAGAYTTAADDNTNGGAAAQEGDQAVVAKNFRDLFGRGPVLDASDDLDLWLDVALEVAGADVDIDIVVQATWDVMTVADARKAFSVPPR